MIHFKCKTKFLHASTSNKFYLWSNLNTDEPISTVNSRVKLWCMTIITDGSKHVTSLLRTMDMTSDGSIMWPLGWEPWIWPKLGQSCDLLFENHGYDQRWVNIIWPLGWEQWICPQMYQSCDLLFEGNGHDLTWVNHLTYWMRGWTHQPCKNMYRSILNISTCQHQ